MTDRVLHRSGRLVRLDFAGDARDRAVELHYQADAIDGDRAQFERAVALYEEAIRVDPRLAEPHVNLGAILWREGRCDEGIAHMKRALEVDPTVEEAAYNLGVIASFDGRYDEAAEWFRLELARDPEHGPSHFHMALLLDDADPLVARKHWLSCLRDKKKLESRWIEMAKRRLEEP